MGKRKYESRDAEFWGSGIENSRSFIFYFNRLKELAISMFEWKNLPDSIDPRFLELSLFNDGKAVFFEDEVLGYLALQVAAGGKLDVYRIPTYRRAYAPNAYNKVLGPDDSVIIFNNYLHEPSFMDINHFAKRLAGVERTMDVNVNAQSTPILIQCSENERLTMKNLYMQYEGRQPFIFAMDNLNTKGITVLKTDAPYMADKLYELKTNIWNEALTYLGVSNINVVKKERMITDEVTRNLGGTVASRYSRLMARQEAADKINKMFGLNISVDYREDFNTDVMEALEEEGKEGEEAKDSE